MITSTANKPDSPYRGGLGLFAILALALLTMVLGGCGTVLNTPEHDQELLTVQIAKARRDAAAAIAAPPLYIGIALYDNEPVFDNDVNEFGQKIAAASATPISSVILSNRPIMTGSRLRPLANAANMKRLFRELGRDKSHDQLSVIVLSSHGLKGGLVISAPDDRKKAVIRPDDLNEMLNALGGRQLIILSACYSGTMIDAIQAPDRLILTAADARNVSFGCNDWFHNTVYIEALMKHLFKPVALSTAYENARREIAERERLFFDTKSNPQLRAGERTSPWLSISLVNLLNTP